MVTPVSGDTWTNTTSRPQGAWGFPTYIGHITNHCMIDSDFISLPTEPNVTLLAGGGGHEGARPQWEGTVTLIGIALCVVCVACTVAFIFHYRITQRKDKAKQLAAANQALLVNGKWTGIRHLQHVLRKLERNVVCKDTT